MSAREEQPWEAEDRRRCLLEALDDEDFRRGLNDLALLLLRGPTWLEAGVAAAELAALAHDQKLAIADLWADGTAIELLQVASNWVRLNAGQPQIPNPLGLPPPRKARPRSDVPITRHGDEIQMPFGDRGQVLQWLDVLQQFQQAGQEPGTPGHPKGQPKPSGSGRPEIAPQMALDAERLPFLAWARLHYPDLEQKRARDRYRRAKSKARRLRGDQFEN